MLKLNTKYQDYLEQLNNLTDDRGNRYCGYHYLQAMNHSGQVRLLLAFHDVDKLIPYTKREPYRNYLNYYLTLNTFSSKVHRTQNNILGLCAVWADIDCDNIGYPKSIVKPILPMLLDNAELPTPTAINDSGHGFHIIWLFSHEVVVHSKKILKRWKILEATVNNRLNESFKELTGKSDFTDSKVEEPARILRIPLTLNIKRKPYIECKTIKYTGVSYSMNWFCNEFINQKYIYKYYGWGKPSPKPKHKKPHFIFPKLKPTDNAIGYINQHRVTDLVRLIELRNQEHKYTGYREVLAWLYCVSIVQELYGSNKESKVNADLIYPCLKSINRMFKIPLDSNQMYSLKKEIPTMTKYVFTNQYFIKRLGITNSESKSLNFLASSHEKRRRHNLSRNNKNRRRSHKFGAKSKRTLRIHKVMILHNSGLSARAIAKQLHIGNKTVSRYIKHY